MTGIREQAAAVLHDHFCDDGDTSGCWRWRDLSPHGEAHRLYYQHRAGTVLDAAEPAIRKDERYRIAAGLDGRAAGLDQLAAESASPEASNELLIMATTLRNTAAGLREYGEEVNERAPDPHEHPGA